jgi:hypothetical protein
VRIIRLGSTALFDSAELIEVSHFIGVILCTECSLSIPWSIVFLLRVTPYRAPRSTFHSWWRHGHRVFGPLTYPNSQVYVANDAVDYRMFASRYAPYFSSRYLEWVDGYSLGVTSIFPAFCDEVDGQFIRAQRRSMAITISLETRLYTRGSRCCYDLFIHT